MLSQWLSAVVSALPIILGSLFVAFLLVGFWKGLGMRPNEPENRVRMTQWWWPGNL